MEKIREIHKFLKDNISEKRYQHIKRVKDTALYLYDYYQFQRDFNFSKEDLEIAALLHDSTKEMNKEFQLQYITEKDRKYLNDENYPIWHGFSAAEYVKKNFQIDNNEIIEAIRYHTTGKENLNDLGLLIYIADYIEPGRRKEAAALIKNIFDYSLEKLALVITKKNNEYLLKNNKDINVLTKNFEKYLKNKEY